MAMAAEGPAGATSGVCPACSKAKFPQLQSAKKGHVQCLMASLERAGLVDKKGRYEALDVDEYGATALHHCCRHDKVQCLSVLVKLAHVRECIKARNGATALHDAAATGSIRCLNYLLKHTEHKFSTADTSLSTPLHWAVQAKQEEAVMALLLAKNATCDVATKLGVTPLHVASAKNNIPIVKHLVNFCLKGGEEAVINRQAKSGATAAYFAAQEGHLECMRYLVEVGRADLSLRAKDKMMCLHAAAQHGHLECLKFIVERCGVQSVNERGPDNATIAHFAAGHGNWECLEWIIENTVLNGKERDHYGGTPLHDAADNNHLECVKGLVDHGVLVIALDNDNHTALDLAVTAGNGDVIAFLQQHLQHLKEEENRRRLAALQSKQHEEQERRQRAKLEKQRRKEQEKLQKMQAKLRQQEEKLREQELKRKQLEAQLAQHTGEVVKTEETLGDAAAGDDAAVINLPPKHEEWDKLEDEAYALAMAEGLDQAGGREDSALMDKDDDKLNISGSVSFRLSDQEPKTAKERRKKDKKEKSKALRGLGRFLRRSNTDRSDTSGDRRGVSRRSSQSSISTDKRPSTPGSASSLATPGSSRAEVVVENELSDTESGDAMTPETAKPRGFVRKQGKVYEKSIKERETHFSRFWQRRGNRQPSTKKSDQEAQLIANGHIMAMTAEEVRTSGGDEVDGPTAVTAGSSQAPPTQQKSRFTQGLANIASALRRGAKQSPASAAIVAPPSSSTRAPLMTTSVPTSTEPSSNDLLTDGDYEDEMEDSTGGEDLQRKIPPQEKRKLSEVRMVVGAQDSIDSLDSPDDKEEPGPAASPQRQFSVEVQPEAGTSMLTTGLAVETHLAWTPTNKRRSTAAEEADNTDEENKQGEEHASLNHLDPTAQTLRSSLRDRQLHLATAMLSGPGEDDDGMRTGGGEGATPTNKLSDIHEAITAASEAQADTSSPVSAQPQTQNLHDALFSTKSMEVVKETTDSQIASSKSTPAFNNTAEQAKLKVQRSSAELFDNLKAELHAEEEKPPQRPRGGLEAALFGASSMEQLASERETGPAMSSKSTGGLEAALFQAKSMEQLACKQENKGDATSPMTSKSTGGLEAALFNASSTEQEVMRRKSSENLLDLVQSLDALGAGLPRTSLQKSSESSIEQLLLNAEDSVAHGDDSAGGRHLAGEEFLTPSRSSRSLTLSNGTLDTIEESDNEGDEKDQSPEDKHRCLLQMMQQRSAAGAEDGMESSRLSSRSTSLPALVESDVEENGLKP